MGSLDPANPPKIDNCASDPMIQGLIGGGVQIWTPIHTLSGVPACTPGGEGSFDYRPIAHGAMNQEGMDAGHGSSV